MKIAIIINLFPPKWLAGTEIATYSLAENLAKHGHEVHVITSLDEGLPKYCFEKGFHTHRLKKFNVRFVGILVFWAHVLMTQQKINPDIIHVQSISNALPAVIAKILFKKPFVVWGRGTDVYLADWFTKLISKIIIKNADSVIALTNDMKQKIQAVYSRDIFVIPNGIDLEKYSRIPKNSKKVNGITILFVGRLHPVKGVQYLIEAMAIIHQEMPGVKLIIVGEGIEREKLEGLTKQLDLKGCIQFVGRVPQEKIPLFMQQADIFVLPSLAEGFPNVLLEAMACGLPIVATRVGGIPEIIEDGRNGFLVNPKKPDEIADKLLFISRNKSITWKISKNNKEKVKKYNWNNIVSNLEEIYRISKFK